MGAARAIRLGPITPRLVNQAALAHYLGRSPSWLSENMSRLIEDEGFPPMNEAMQLYDLKKVDEWLDGARVIASSNRVNGDFR